MLTWCAVTITTNTLFFLFLSLFFFCFVVFQRHYNGTDIVLPLYHDRVSPSILPYNAVPIFCFIATTKLMDQIFLSVL